MNRVSLIEVEHLIKDADILLFRNSGYGISWLISKLTASPYSHAALAHWCNGLLSVLEFREFVGSRKTTFEWQTSKGYIIDVFRIKPTCTIDSYENGEIVTVQNEFTSEIAKQITDHAESLIGHPYSYKVIAQIGKTFIPGMRLCIDKDIDGKDMYVCSTLVARSYAKYYLDLTPGISDVYTTPGDLGRSSLLDYLFTICS